MDEFETVLGMIGMDVFDFGAQQETNDVALLPAESARA